MSKLDLRKKLQKIIPNISEWSDFNKSDAQLKKQIRLIQDLSVEYSHSISVARAAERGRLATYKYTCYMYAFDLMNEIELKNIAQVPVRSIRVQSLFLT